MAQVLEHPARRSFPGVELDRHLVRFEEAASPGWGWSWRRRRRRTLLELLTPTPTDGALLPIGNKRPANGASPDEQLFTVQEVATRFGLTPDWLYRHWKAVGGVKLGRKVLRFPASALPRYLEAQRKRAR
jgi:hypothetical protein